MARAATRQSTRTILKRRINRSQSNGSSGILSEPKRLAFIRCFPITPLTSSPLTLMAKGGKIPSVNFLVAKKHKIPIAIERSRSGNGAHAWLFFTEPYPALKSRKIFFALLREASIIGLLDKNENFDRLFPNQDYHSGKGIGNLIAFPLQGAARKLGNSVFVNPNKNFSAYDDQWQFLHDVSRLTPQELDARYATLTGDAISETLDEKPSKLTLTISNAIAISKNKTPAALVSYLRDELNMSNVEYFVKERAGMRRMAWRNTLRLSRQTIVMSSCLADFCRSLLRGLRNKNPLHCER